MKRVTLDSNVWLSALFWQGEASRIVELAEKKKIVLYSSKEILLEIAKVLERETKFRSSSESIREVIDKIADLSNDTVIKTRTGIVHEDPDDNKIIDCAINSKSEFLITYDKHLLKLRNYKKIKIVHPTKFLKF